jgi:hypothetical protein
MGMDTVTLGEILKEVYAPGDIIDLQNLTAPLLSKIGESTDHTIGGKNFRFPVNVTGDEGYGFIDEAGALPNAQNEHVEQAQLTPKVFAGVVQVTGLSVAISSQDSMSFANGIKYHFDKKFERMFVYKNSVLYRDGTGKLAAFNADDGDTTVLLTLKEPGTQWLRRNMVVDIFDGGTLKTSNRKLGEVNHITNQVKFTEDFNTLVVADDDLYLAGTQPTVGGPLPREFLGLEAALPDSEASGTYLGLSRATYPEWRGNSYNAAGNSVNEDELLLMKNRILIVGGLNTNNMSSLMLIMHPNQSRKYFAAAVPQRQFSGMSFDLGYKTLEWEGHPFCIDHHCPRTTIYMGDMTYWKRFEAPDGAMQIDTTFGPPVKWTPSFDSGQAYVREYAEYANCKPNSWVKGRNFADVGTI